MAFRTGSTRALEKLTIKLRELFELDQSVFRSAGKFFTRRADLPTCLRSKACCFSSRSRNPFYWRLIYAATARFSLSFISIGLTERFRVKKVGSFQQIGAPLEESVLPY